MGGNTKVPTCVGIIMDGNRRWAKERGMPTMLGHREGSERFRDAVLWLQEREVPHVVVFALSTENLKRAEEEVSYMMDLIREKFVSETDELAEKNVRVRIVGRRDVFPEDIQDIFNQVEEKTHENTGITAWVCVGYGGRAEIMHAASMVDGDVTEESFSEALWTVGMPDPDLIIRTGGERRLSGFLTWQSVYSELFFVDEKWPDFSEAILDRVLGEFGDRERRYGK